MVELRVPGCGYTSFARLLEGVERKSRQSMAIEFKTRFLKKHVQASVLASTIPSLQTWIMLGLLL